MKREDLTKLGLTDDAVIDAIMTAHGKDIEKHKTVIDTSKAELDALKSQLVEANKQIEDFKGLDIDSVKKAADDYKAKFEQAQQEHATQLEDIKFNHVLDSALTRAKVKNLKAVKPLLDLDALKKAYDPKTETIIGFDEHLKPVKSENDYLFEGDGRTPVIVKGTNNQNVLGNALIDAARRGAKLPEPKQG